jgi:hypothetical protein
MWTCATMCCQMVLSVVMSGFREGSEVAYTDAMGMLIRTVGTGGLTLTLTGVTELEL